MQTFTCLWSAIMYTSNIYLLRMVSWKSFKPILKLKAQASQNKPGDVKTIWGPGGPPGQPNGSPSIPEPSDTGPVWGGGPGCLTQIQQKQNLKGKKDEEGC